MAKIVAAIYHPATINTRMVFHAMYSQCRITVHRHLDVDSLYCSYSSRFDPVEGDNFHNCIIAWYNGYCRDSRFCFLSVRWSLYQFPEMKVHRHVFFSVSVPDIGGKLFHLSDNIACANMYAIFGNW